ncbi:hypothetical protein FGE12_26680 [Aggregicoccus sp. 17bor-14]|uniref:ATP-binding protein n=1 Tax=Myxococcaceae TaxID=31 RepID=UPI00129C71C5|nr:MULTISPECIES: ATP-binding protein [Myxococcaceae]MBF5046027.1 ATP-binding protein [Simulacricoccus sp. 17bor-14]MRI91758.1 hypothetical protein [Aggregicoccus sp. 17bor-14]
MPDETPPWPQIGSPLDDVNAAFHEAYDGARSSAEERAPVLVLLGDVLVVDRAGRRSEHPFTPPVHHALKSGAHAPVALFSLLHGVGDGPLDSSVCERLARLRGQVDASLGKVERDAPEASAAGPLRALLEATRAETDRVLEAGRTSREALAAYAHATGPALLRLVDEATRVQLEALHAQVEELLAGMTPKERAALQVVVAGAHQARERSLGMQYFQKRLGEPEGLEERVTFAENVADVDQALALVGARRFDRALARAFFGDPRRLQRDVLGDATAAHLARLELPPPPPAAPDAKAKPGAR